MNSGNLSIKASVQLKPAKLYFISFIRGFAILNDTQIRAIIKKASVPLTKCLVKLITLYAEERIPRNRAIPQIQYEQVKKVTKSLRTAKKRRSSGRSVKMQLQKNTSLLRLIAEDFLDQVIACDQNGNVNGDQTYNYFIELPEMFKLEEPKQPTIPLPITKPMPIVYEMHSDIVV